MDFRHCLDGEFPWIVQRSRLNLENSRAQLGKPFGRSPQRDALSPGGSQPAGAFFKARPKAIRT